MNKTKRQVLAILIAPLTPGFAITLIPAMLSMSWPYSGQDYPIILVVFALISFVGFFTIGLPIAAFLKKRVKLTLLRLSLMGGGAGVLFYLCSTLLLTLILQAVMDVSISSIFFMFALGVLVAFSYGVISGSSAE